MSKQVDINIELVNRCKKGDSKAQYQLFRLYSKAMYNIAFRFFNNKMDTEDIIQESFVQAFSKIKSFKGESTFGAWLKRIVINKCLSEIRKRKIHYDDITPKLESEAIDEDIDEQIKPELVHEAIKQLPEGARIIVNLHVFEGYKHKDIAEMLNITESTCKTQFKRAKNLLAEYLKKYMYEYEN